MIYLAALAARRYDKTLNTFANALIARGKPPKLAIRPQTPTAMDQLNIVAPP